MNSNDTSLWELYLYLRFALGRRLPISSKEEKFDKHSALHKLYLAYIPENVHIINQNRDEYNDTYVYHRRLVERFITLIHGKAAVESVRRMSRAHFSLTNMNFMSMITKAEQDQVFGSIDCYEWHNDPETTIMDFLVLTNIFDSEEEVVGELNASMQHKNRGIHINNVPIRNAKQIFLPDIHILPNKLSIVQTKRKIFVIQWIDDFELSQARFCNHIITNESITLHLQTKFKISMEAYYICKCSYYSRELILWAIRPRNNLFYFFRMK